MSFLPDLPARAQAVRLGRRAHCSFLSFLLSICSSSNQLVAMETSPPVRGRHFLTEPAPPTTQSGQAMQVPYLRLLWGRQGPCQHTQDSGIPKGRAFSRRVRAAHSSWPPDFLQGSSSYIIALSASNRPEGWGSLAHWAEGKAEVQLEGQRELGSYPLPEPPPPSCSFLGRGV